MTPGLGVDPHSDQIILDADVTEQGWEIVLRHGAEDMIVCLPARTDADLTKLSPTIGRIITDELIAVRDQERT